jgi:methyl-accepting chemotaxis protein
MNRFSLRSRIIFVTFIISLIVPLVAYFIVSRNNETAAVYQNIANVALAKVDKLGDMLSNFRQVRVEVRSLGLIDNTVSDSHRYVTDTAVAIAEFEKSKNDFKDLLSTDEEREQFIQMDKAWEDFHTFGKRLLVLAKKGDSESIKKLAEEVRVTCPIKKEGVEKLIRSFLTTQKAQSQALVSEAKKSEKTTAWFAFIGTVIGLVSAALIGIFFASRVCNALEESISSLVEGVTEINNKSLETSDISTRISTASTQQASSLQETVASIDEISAMVSRNADSASSAASSTDTTTKSAQKGKEKVGDMLDSINAISHGNDEIISQMQKSNAEISDIVGVIQEISQKTQVINDIVFQTKLLSFNASVEAARAGDHGKGFSVVAEEVGNLASMSGNAANEISEMLSRSVKRVTGIVNNTTVLMDTLIHESKDKVESGTKTANDCAHALDDILNNVSSMSQMVREISNASQEQSTGIREINMAMSDLDQVTKANSLVAHTSSMTAKDLKSEADKLKDVASQLTSLVRGHKATSAVNGELINLVDKRSVESVA